MASAGGGGRTATGTGRRRVAGRRAGSELAPSCRAAGTPPVGATPAVSDAPRDRDFGRHGPGCSGSDVVIRAGGALFV